MNQVLDLENIQKQLEEKRAVLSLRVRVKPGQSDAADLANPDRSDLAQRYFSKERQAAIVERMEDTLEQVEAALKRLDEGTYGRCSQCGKDISPERLEALPYADLCIDCQEKMQTG